MPLILSTEVRAPASAPIIMPVDGIALWANPRGSGSQAVRNFANEDAPMTVVGSPGYGATYADLKSVTSFAYFNSGVGTGLTAWSLLAISAPLDNPPTVAESPQMISSFENSGGAWRGIGLGFATSASTPCVRGSFAGTTAASPSASVESFVQTAGMTNPMAIRATAFRGSNSGLMRVDDLTEGTFGEAADARTAVQVAAMAQYRIGSSGNGANRYSRTRVYFAAIVPRVISDTELDTIIGQAARALAADGVTVALAA